MAERLQLGMRAKDRVSGWEGWLVARYEYLNGCVRWEIGGGGGDGKPDAYVFDQQQVQQVGTRTLTPTSDGPNLEAVTVEPPPPAPVVRAAPRTTDLCNGEP